VHEKDNALSSNDVSARRKSLPSQTAQLEQDYLYLPKILLSNIFLRKNMIN